MVVAEIDPRKGRYRVERLGEEGVEALFVEMDVASEPQVRAMVEAAVERFGGVDVLVNNAGVGRRGARSSRGSTISSTLPEGCIGWRT